jgi:hypothetical protein
MRLLYIPSLSLLVLYTKIWTKIEKSEYAKFYESYLVGNDDLTFIWSKSCIPILGKEFASISISFRPSTKFSVKQLWNNHNSIRWGLPIFNALIRFLQLRCYQTGIISSPGLNCKMNVFIYAKPEWNRIFSWRLQKYNLLLFLSGTLFS